MSKEESAAEDRQVEMWKVKKLIKSLQAARGYVTLTNPILLITFNELCATNYKKHLEMEQA